MSTSGKKRFALAALAATAAVSLAACGGGGKGTTAPSGDQSGADAGAAS